MRKALSILVLILAACGAESVTYQEEMSDRATIRSVGMKCGCNDKVPVYYFCTPLLSGPWLMDCKGPDLNQDGTGYCCETTGGRIPAHYVEARKDPRDAIRFPVPLSGGQWALDITNGLYGFYVW